MNKRVAYIGLLTAIAIIFGYIEMLIPVFIGIPGIKLGLANLVIVFALYSYGIKEAFLISGIRIVVIGFLFGNLFSIAFGMTGTALSILIMCLLKKCKGVSMIGVSIAGGVFHNIGQIIIAAFVVENAKLFYYIPVLLTAGMITGLLIGIVSRELVKRLGYLAPKMEEDNKKGL